VTADRWDDRLPYPCGVALTESMREGSAPPEDSGRARIRLRQPPGRLFHAALVLPTLGLLWSHSVPGLAFFLWSGAVALLFVGAVVWGVRLLSYAVAKRRNKAEGRARWFLVAPAAGVVVLALIVSEAPLKARWSLGRSDFESVAREALQDEDYSDTESQRIGLYNITHVYRQGEAVIFYERTGVLSDDAGFAYLPNGPFPELENGGFERPEFRHLGGPWYAWTASW
jgi:hypothetical protein